MRLFGGLHSNLPIGLSHRLGDGNVVSSLHCMNDPQPKGHMASYIERRKFLATLGGAAAWPLAARAQQPGKLPTIGFIGAETPSAGGQLLAGFVARLSELGWVDGRNVAIEYRWAEGRNEPLAEFAAEFVRRKVDVIVTGATPPTIAAKQATSIIPIVFAAAGDPIGTGLVASLAQRAATSPACHCNSPISLANASNCCTRLFRVCA